jgi:hypothetical protein
LETHRDCQDVAIIENVVKDVKTSDIFNEIEELIREMTETIGNIRQNRETNSRELRTKINNHLDNLQEDLMTELTEAAKHITEETRVLMVYLDEKQKEPSEHQTHIGNIKRYASDLQTYLAVKQIEKEIESQDTYLQTIVNSDSLNQTTLSYKIGTGLRTITTNIQTFGEVVIESKPCELTFV